MDCTSAEEMAGPTGFEPATSRLTIWRPNQAERRPRSVNDGGRVFRYLEFEWRIQHTVEHSLVHH